MAEFNKEGALRMLAEYCGLHVPPAIAAAIRKAVGASDE